MFTLLWPIMVVNSKNKSKTNSGQAVFELIFFLPIFALLIRYFITIGNSFNMSINQQKATRRYFYYLAKGNSKIPGRFDLTEWGEKSFKYASMTSVSWSQKNEDDQYYASCSELSGFLKPDEGESCDDKITGVSSEKTGFIRVYTSYGICGGNYVLDSTTSKFTSSYLQTGSVSGCRVSE